MEESTSTAENKTDSEETGSRIVTGGKLPPKKTFTVRAKDLRAIETNAVVSKTNLVEEKTSANTSKKGFEWEWFFMVLGMVCFALITPPIAMVPVCALGFLVASIATVRYMRGGRTLVGFVSAIGILFFLVVAVRVRLYLEEKSTQLEKEYKQFEEQLKTNYNQF